MRKILIVDDELDIGQAIATLLRFRGYDPDVAITGVAALRMAEEQAVGLVLLDWNLRRPGPTGAALVKKLRERCGRVPIVLVSADKQALQEALEAGVDDYLSKPFIVSELMRIVDDYCITPNAA
jgi:two-component system KDP operon response regulator KdpE